MDILFPLRVIHGKLDSYMQKKKAEREYKQYFQRSNGVKALILGTPAHSNIGDSAIVLAEISFLEKCGYSAVKEITTAEFSACENVLFDYIRNSNDPAYYLHGGGNMGNQWFGEERFRRRLMKKLPDHPVVIFPQTIYYSETEEGKQAERESISFYNNRESLTIVAREEKSEEIMRSLYPDTNILLTPDIVLSTTMEQYGVTPQGRKGVMLCVRSDIEKSVEDTVWTSLEEFLDSLGTVHRRSDMYSDISVTKENRGECVRRKMQEFCGAELVITDRLHGMVFAALTGTPCVTFGNNHYKVKGTYDWISYLPYIRYVESAEEAKSAIPELLAMRDCRYDNAPLMPYFEKLVEVVKNYAKN